MKKTTFIPVLVFAFCGTSLIAQNTSPTKELIASSGKKSPHRIENPDYFMDKKMKSPTVSGAKRIYMVPVKDKDVLSEKKPLAPAVSVSAFPNPVANDLFITIKDAGVTESMYEIALYDLQGRKVFAKESFAKTEKLNIASLASGTYVLQIQKNSEVILKEKVIKE